MINCKYEELADKVKKRLKNVSNLCLTTDLWTDPINTKSYICLTSHFIDKDEHVSIVLGVFDLNESHTAVNISSWLLEVLNIWEIKLLQVDLVVTDNAKNIAAAVKKTFGADKHMGCFAHKLNLVVMDALKATPNALSIVKKVKIFVKHSKHCVDDYDKLKKQTELKLIQSVDTRWNSTYYMIERFVELSELISIIFLENKKCDPMLSAVELYTLKEFLKILKPFEIATKIVSGEKF